MAESVNGGEGSGDPLDKVVRIGSLIDLYGGLLTERQLLFIRLHYNDDLSFGEIARNHGVSRQAIHDAVKHAEAALEDYESKLGLMEKGYSRTAAAPLEQDSAPATADSADEEPARETSPTAVPDDAKGEIRDVTSKLRALHERLRLSGGIIYNGEGVTREIGEIADRLEKVTGP